jgi:hypothetical protein
MRKNICLFVTVMAFILMASGTAMAYPDRQSICSDCHNRDTAVKVTAVSQDCSGSNANYTVTVSNTYDAGEGWAIFNGTSNIANGSGTSGSFSVPAGTGYEVWGVSDSDQGIGGGKGGSNYVVISPYCAPACTDADGDTYALDGGNCGPVDCDDTDVNINPGAQEDCTNGVDDDCDNLIDSADPDASNCPLPCTDVDGDLYFSEGGSCGPVDCIDSDASINPGVLENCTNGIDDDCDGYTDGDDTDCGGCVPTGREGKGRTCRDGLDNDCDGLFDREDPDCFKGKPRGILEICDDGIDNDGDRKIDCSDKKDCGKDPACN